MNAPVAMAAVVAALGGFMIVVRLLQKRRIVGSELGRKLVHAGMGVIALSFPWVFMDSRPVWVLAVLSIAILCAVRLVPSVAKHFGDVLGGVARASLGDLFFPLGVAVAFALARGNAASFCGAVGVLSFADTAGALVGTRWGKTRYSIAGNKKSLEGSSAVWITSSLCIAVASTTLGSKTVVAGAAEGLAVGFAAALVEAVSPFGLDNLLLPAVVVELMRL